ncbi:MAG: glycosyltransferase family 1 protein [Gemmatales bacterium]|nr:glycosyltransferase family 1 protein [Gemmatales bacterium]
MQIVLNTWTGLGLPAGIGHYAQQLASALQRTAADGDTVRVFPRGVWAQWYQWWMSVRRVPGVSAQLKYSSLSSWRGLVRCWPAALRSWWSTSVREALRWALGRSLRRYLRAVRAELYLEPNFVPLCWDVPVIITVHDLSPILYPHWHPDYRVRWLEKHLPRSLACAQRVLTVSEWTRQELVRHCGMSPERITVTYPGMRNQFRPFSRHTARRMLSRWGLPTDFILYVGTLEPRKNLERVLRTFLRLPRSCRRAVPFVLAGQYGWGAASLAELIAATGPDEGIYPLGYVPEKWLPWLYNAARALVYPSYYEGFGLPPLEMLACGGTVVVADLPVFQETLGSLALRVPADDVDAWHRVLYRLVVTDEFAHSEPNPLAVAWARRFSWENCALQTWRTFKSLPTIQRLAA